MSTLPNPRPVLSERELSILRTVCYSSVFEYPLTLEELESSLLELGISRTEILETYQESAALRRLVAYDDDYFVLRGRQDWIHSRKEREQFSRGLLSDNLWVLRLICAIPGTRMLALSGGAAHLNLRPEDDIDLFLLTRQDRAWTVAVTMLLLVKLLGKRRLICFNFLLSEQELEFPRTDLFAANQFIHLRPMMGSDRVVRLTGANPFVRKFYPNFVELKRAELSCEATGLLKIVKKLLEGVLDLGLSRPLEAVARGSYRWYLLRKSDQWRSPEDVVLSDQVLKLHTNGYRRLVYRRFNAYVEECLSRTRDSEPWEAHEGGDGS